MYNCLLQEKYYKLHNNEYISISYETYTYNLYMNTSFENILVFTSVQ